MIMKKATMHVFQACELFTSHNEGDFVDLNKIQMNDINKKIESVKLEVQQIKEASAEKIIVIQSTINKMEKEMKDINDAIELINKKIK